MRFDSPYGKEVAQWLRHGIGIHHAGLLPKYRLIVEKLAQKGLLKIISGTDTLGVGVNVPIRTVLFTKLCKFDGEKTAILSVRDFQQISGRAGRKGFDDDGSVVAQAPEHVIENLRLEEKAEATGKKVVKASRPSGATCTGTRRRSSASCRPPEPLVSRFSVSHGMVVNVLSREEDGGWHGRSSATAIKAPGTRATRTSARSERTAFELFKSLNECGHPDHDRRRGSAAFARQRRPGEDFSIHHALSLYLLDTATAARPRVATTHELDLLTLVESILENPDIILRRQLDKLKGDKVAEMKAAGVEYDERMGELEKLEYPKPQRRVHLRDVQRVRREASVGGQDNIRPKSIAREMYENFMSFSEYVREYGLERVEGVLLRYLSDVYKALVQTVPDGAKTDAVDEIATYFARHRAPGRLEPARRVGADARPRLPPLGTGGADLRPPRPEEPPDVTRDVKAFTAAVRTRSFAFLRAWSIGDDEAALGTIDAPADADGQPWTVERLRAAREEHRAEHHGLRLDPEARNLRHTYVDPSGGKLVLASPANASRRRRTQRLGARAGRGHRRLARAGRARAEAAAPRQPGVAPHRMCRRARSRVAFADAQSRGSAHRHTRRSHPTVTPDGHTRRSLPDRHTRPSLPTVTPDRHSRPFTPDRHDHPVPTTGWSASPTRFR